MDDPRQLESALLPIKENESLLIYAAPSDPWLERVEGLLKTNLTGLKADLKAIYCGSPMTVREMDIKDLKPQEHDRCIFVPFKNSIKNARFLVYHGLHEITSISGLQNLIKANQKNTILINCKDKTYEILA